MGSLLNNNIKENQYLKKWHKIFEDINKCRNNKIQKLKVV